MEVLDSRGALRCVRFDSGDVGVMNAQGKSLMVLGPYQQLRFAGNGFLRVMNRWEFFIDMRNGELYAQMPEFIHFGEFELAYIGGHLCTRTKRLYEVQAIPAEAWLGKGGMFLKLPFNGEPEEETVRRMLERRKRYEVCLLNGDESGVYWLTQVMDDWSVLVMDEEGNYYHATKSTRSAKAVKRLLGKVEREADKTRIVHAVREIEEQVADRLKREAEKAKRDAEKERKRELTVLLAAEPFSIGNKWGLRNKGRIVVPPIYRQVKSPVGHYCVVESYPGCWGVIAVDGKVEVDARYEHVEIHPDGTVDLTVRPGKVITRKLSSI